MDPELPPDAVVAEELRQQRLLLADILLATARLTTWMGAEHRGESHDQYQSYRDVLDCINAATARLDAMRDERGNL